uniref:EGF-like domain-containing protein n=1 Tax=Anopheles maculatus TaxID=74869 RepID=A0A182SAJ4_9DIPT
MFFLLLSLCLFFLVFVDDSNDQDGAQAQPGGNGQKRKPGARGQNIQEETDLEPELAARLDLSCMAQGLIRAPEIDNGYVVKYNRRKKNGNIFLVAFYECDDYYELQPPEHDRLYCSGRKWIGKRPECISTRTGSDDDEEGEDEEEEEEEEEEDYEEEGAEDSEQPSGRDEQVHERTTTPTTTTTMPTTTTSTTESTTTTTTEPSTTPSTTTTTEQPTTASTPEDPPATESSEPANLSVPEVEPVTTHPHRQSTADHQESDDNEEDDAEADPDEEEGDDDEEDDRQETHKVDDHQEPAPSSTEPVPVVTSPQTVVAACGPDRGGCDHECRMIYHGNEVESVVECSCYRGFLLDARDGRTCHDIDECAENNGGCEQTCINKPGSYECSCEPGLQIDTLNGHTCIGKYGHE